MDPRRGAGIQAERLLLPRRARAPVRVHGREDRVAHPARKRRVVVARLDRVAPDEARVAGEGDEVERLLRGGAVLGAARRARRLDEGARGDRVAVHVVPQVARADAPLRVLDADEEVEA